jgi:hypothetical protein
MNFWERCTLQDQHENNSNGAHFLSVVDLLHFALVSHETVSVH